MVSGLAWMSACAVSVALAANDGKLESPDLKSEVRAALAETMPARGEIDDAEGSRLLELFQRVEQTERLAEREQERLLASLRRRLVSAAEQAHRRAKRPSRTAKSVSLREEQAVLAQQQPLGAQPAPAAANGPPPNGANLSAGDELARLIVTTIAPESWDVNGGNGSIYYYDQWQCLVVRQTDDIHNRLGRLVVDLRQQ